MIWAKLVPWAPNCEGCLTGALNVLPALAVFLSWLTLGFCLSWVSADDR